MADIEKFGRTFSFDDDVSDAQRDSRIQNWMQKHAPDELKAPADKPAQPAADVPIVQSSTNIDKSAKSNFNPKLAMLSTMLLGPLGPLGLAVPGVRERMGDVNAYRTVAQGAVPFADEITAGARSLAGTPYDKALAEERQGVKDYGDKYGEMERGALEFAGALGTLPLGVGAIGAATKAVPGGAKLAALIAKHPFLASIGTGATAGGVSSFGAGEGGLENRLSNAGMGAGLGAVLGPAAYGGVKAVEKAGNWLITDNRLANYLRTKIASEKNLDPTSSTFNQDADRVLTHEMANQTHLRTDPRVSDLLPETTEAALGTPGRGASQLAKSLYERQYNKNLPEAQALAESQHGRIGNALDTAFGPDMFKHSDEMLLKTRSANAQQGFTPAYAKNVRTAEIDDALDRMHILSPDIWTRAKKWADAERRPIGAIDATGNLRSYNTQFLHDIKRSADEVLGEQGRMNPKFNQVPFNNAKSDLNKAIMDANPEYKSAMLKYGEDSSYMGALKKGREEVFVPGSVDKTGAMDADAIRTYLADPNEPQAAKDLFMTGAARALRENVLASQSKKVTHNWADFLNNPEYEKRVGALVNGRQLGGWDLFRSRLKQESENYKNAARATGNSRTQGRQALKEEAEGVGSNAMAALGLLINPMAPSGFRGTLSLVRDKLDPTRKMMNKTATILSRSGQDGTRQSLEDIARMLNESSARDARYKKIGSLAPSVTGLSLPYRDN